MAKRNTTTTATTTGKRGGLVRTGKRGSVTTAATTAVAVVDMATLTAFARTVTPDNFGASLSVVNMNHGIAHGGRNVNRFNGTRIEFTQNATFVANAVDQLTDTQLLFIWCAAFPMAAGRVFDANRATDAASMRAAILNGVAIVAGARRAFNAGKHGNVAPASPSVRYGGRPTFATVAPSA